MATESAGSTSEEQSEAEPTAYVSPTADFVILFALSAAMLLGATVIMLP